MESKVVNNHLINFDYMTQRTLAISLKLQGLSYSAIAKQLGVSRQRAVRLVRPNASVYAMAIRRAGGMCQSCFKPLAGGAVHHRTIACDAVVYNSLANLLYVCRSCHPHLENNVLVVLDL